MSVARPKYQRVDQAVVGTDLFLVYIPGAMTDHIERCFGFGHNARTGA
jgi:hypothetical protein